jgi:AraC-like DNA-binding protein
VIPIRGCCRLRLGGEAFDLSPGRIAYIAPSVAHEMEELREDTDFWTLQIDARLLGSALCRMGLAEESPQDRVTAREPALWAMARTGELFPDPPVVEITTKHRSDIEQRATLAWQAYLEAWTGSGAAIPGCEWIPPWTPESARGATDLLVDVVVAVLRAADEGRGRAPRLARHAFDVIARDPRLSRAELCRELEVSEGYLSRVFPEVFGTSLAAQRARLRATSFLSLATEPRTQNLLEACLGAGFGSYAQLSRVFSTLSPFSPRTYLWGGGDLRAAKVTR